MQKLWVVTRMLNHKTESTFLLVLEGYNQLKGIKDESMNHMDNITCYQYHMDIKHMISYGC